MKIEIAKEDLSKCIKFAEEIDTSYYATRNQFNNQKRIKDQVVGKLAELAVFKYLTSKDVDISYPDFEIYEKKNKSWDYDLKSENINVHVKGQNVEQSKKYGESWIFQKQDKHIFIENKKNDYVSFVLIDLNEMLSDVRMILPLDLLHENNLFKAPKLPQLNTKLAVYFSDIEKYQNYSL